MSNIFIALLGYVFLTGIYWYLYFLFRKKVSHIYLLILFAVSMVGPILYFGLRFFKIENLFLDICMGTMVVFAILHHISLLKRVEIIHGTISHLGFFIPFGVAGLIGFSLLHPRAFFIGDTIVLYLWFIETAIFSVIGVLLGLRKLKLWY